MNIKINRYAKYLLLEHTVSTIQFGNIQGEDTDLLHIVIPNVQMDCVPVDNNHTLFYKDTEENTDHLFITPRGFINGLVTGANTLFYEILQEGKLELTCLDFLSKYKDDFISYKLLKAFIGCSQRDFKQASNHKDKEKKIKWSLVYLNLVREKLGLETVDKAELNMNIIKSTREYLNVCHQNHSLPFSVDINVFEKILKHLSLVRVLDIPQLYSIPLYYYNNWSED